MAENKGLEKVEGERKNKREEKPYYHLECDTG
jgi:hypothetical protein